MSGKIKFRIRNRTMDSRGGKACNLPDGVIGAKHSLDQRGAQTKVLEVLGTLVGDGVGSLLDNVVITSRARTDSLKVLVDLGDDGGLVVHQDGEHVLGLNTLTKRRVGSQKTGHGFPAVSAQDGGDGLEKIKRSNASSSGDVTELAELGRGSGGQNGSGGGGSGGELHFFF